MMLAGFLHLQALLVVAMIGSSFGIGGVACFGEFKDWARWFGMDAGSKRFVARGRSGMCLAVYGGPGVDFQSAANACNVSFVGGRLLSNDSWGAFVETREYSEVLSEFNKTIYIGFSPKPELGCFVIDEHLKVTVEDPCRMERRNFVCEYPRQEFCRWEVMQRETPVRRPDGQWELTKEVMQLQEADGSEVSCEPDIEATRMSAKMVACWPLFNDTWSQWSECGRSCGHLMCGYSCGNERLQGYQQRYQFFNDRCARLVDGILRYHTRSCLQVPCSTEAGVSEISISHIPMLFVFLSMYSY